MSIFQKAYDWIASFKTPRWLKAFLQEIQDMLVATLLQIGKEYLKNLENKILEVADMNIPSDQKFMIVFTWGKQNIPNIKDSILNLAIEILVSLLKKNSFVRVIT